MSKEARAGTKSSLGAMLRAWRDRASPASPAAGRRAPGLRREELAERAGLSVDYVVRLEQGRAAHPSPQVVAALARALQLSAAERAHLHALAGVSEPKNTRVPEEVPPSLEQLMERLKGTPVALFSAAWTPLRWNAAWKAVFGAPPEGPGRNLAWRVFLQATAPFLPVPAEQRTFEEVLAGELRGAAGRYLFDDGLRSLVEALLERSPRFAELWKAAAVEPYRAQSKTVQTRLGPLALDWDVLLTGTDLRLVVCTAAVGSEAERTLAALQNP